MAVQFILGSSGTGKTTYIYKKMIEQSMEVGHAPILFVLPEQSNMAAEQEMVNLHPNGGTMDISIVSFTRLAFKVLDELNVHTKDILDDYGKSMMLMKVLKVCEPELLFYKSMVGKQGFVDELKSVLSELYQYQVTEEVLENTICNISPEKSLYYKLKDLKLLLHTFTKEMGESYMVAEQILSLLSEVVADSKLLRGAEIYFDGFTGFTPAQCEVIDKLMCVGCNLHFSFTIDGNLFGDNGYSEHSLFGLSKQTIDLLCSMAQKNQVEVMPHIDLETNYRLKGRKQLLHLERQLFRFPSVLYKEQSDELRILQAKNAREEALFIARYIKKKVKEEGYHYRDFAVVTGDLDKQVMVWKQIMNQLDVPYFLDFSESLSHNPIAEMIRGVLELYQSDFSYDSVFTFLKSGFLDIDLEDVYQLENYALKYGVRGYSWWSKAFRRGAKGLLHELNEIRKQFIDTLSELSVVFRKDKATAKEYIYALYHFLDNNHMAQKLQYRSSNYEKEGKLREAKAYGQVYEKYIAILDKTMDILGEEEIERQHLIEIVLTGLSDMKLGVIPSTLDQVMIGDMERSRMHHVRILFVAGTNEGLIPKAKQGKGILADKDRKQLKELELTLAPDTTEEMFIGQFYLYLQITQPSEQLFLLYRKEDALGSSLQPSYFINRICSIFPSVEIHSAEEFLKNYYPMTEEEIVMEFATSLAKENMVDSSLYQLMSTRKKEVLERILEGYFYNNQANNLNQKIAKKLYGEHMVHSVSRLESYAGCAYQFFLKFGLKIAKREEYTVETNNIGTILHAVMERFFVQVKEGAIEVQSIKKEELDRIIEQITVAAAKEENETIFESSYRNKHQLEVLMRIAKRSIDNLLRHLKQGGMEPAYFEKEFSPEDKLSYIRMYLEQDMQMELRGIVDRVDIKETEDKVYVKIIDYKSGAKDIDYLKMYEGKQLQLTVYMSVMLELLKRQYPNKQIVPTGMYYYHIWDPIIEEIEEEKVELKRIDKNKLTGLVNGDDECLLLMDEKTGTVVPVRYKKDGGMDARTTSVVTTEELSRISDFVKNKMTEIGEDIIRGQISMNPEKGEQNCPCNFCDFKNVCRFEPGLGGNAYRIAPQLDKQEVKDIILGNNDEKGGEDA